MRRAPDLILRNNDGDCSIPVHKCSRCGDHDYGENAEAERTLSTCLYAIELEELEQAG